MGMFDYVDVEIKCPYCGHLIPSGEFQTKDHDRLLNHVHPNTIRNFYGDCPKCEKWIEYNKIEKPEKPFNIKEWKLETTEDKVAEEL